MSAPIARVGVEALSLSLSLSQKRYDTKEGRLLNINANISLCKLNQILQLVVGVLNDFLDPPPPLSSSPPPSLPHKGKKEEKVNGGLKEG